MFCFEIVSIGVRFSEVPIEMLGAEVLLNSSSSIYNTHLHGSKKEKIFGSSWPNEGGLASLKNERVSLRPECFNNY